MTQQSRHPARQLPIGAFVRSKTVLEMDVSADERAPALCQYPFDCSPIIGEQRVRSHCGKLTPDADQVGEIDRAALGQAHRPRVGIDSGVEPVDAGEIAIEGENRMAILRPEPTGEGGEAGLRATDRKGREDVKQMRNPLISVHGPQYPRR